MSFTMLVFVYSKTSEDRVPVYVPHYARVCLVCPTEAMLVKVSLECIYAGLCPTLS